MTLPITIPNTFATATGNLSLSLLDANFTTVANGVNGIGNGTNTLTAPVITGGNIALSAIGYVGAANTVIMSNGSQWIASTTLGKLLQKSYNSTTSVITGASASFGNSIPANTIGSQVFSVSFTPQSNTSNIRISGVIAGSLVGASTGTVAIFSGNNGSASYATYFGTGSPVSIPYCYEEASANTSARTYTLRVAGGGGFNFNTNADASGTRLGGGACICTFVIEEFA